MSDEPALLAAIRAHPDEDTPRLVYADWLDENGRPERAEFIRLQCLPEPSEEQAARAADLEDLHRGRWLIELGVPPFGDVTWSFRRGFPELLDADLGGFLARFGAFARVPWLRALTLREASNANVRYLMSREWPARWVELELLEDFSDNPDDDATPAVLAVARCPQVRQLRRLRLSLSPFAAAGWRALDPLLKELGDRLVID